MINCNGNGRTGKEVIITNYWREKLSLKGSFFIFI